MRKDAMPKSPVVRRASRSHGRPRPAELPNIEGQIAELCRDLAVEAKRMRQLQEQAEELRRAIRHTAGHGEADATSRRRDTTATGETTRWAVFTPDRLVTWDNAKIAALRAARA